MTVSTVRWPLLAAEPAAVTVRAILVGADDPNNSCVDRAVPTSTLQSTSLTMGTHGSYEGGGGIPSFRRLVRLDAGKHVLVEKPLDVSVEAASRVVDTARRSGLAAAVVSQHRFDPASRAVHDALRRGRFGLPTSCVKSMPWWRDQAYYDMADWRGTALLDGGALLNQAVHTVDLMTWFLGVPDEVFAWTALLAHERIEVEDTAVAVVRFPSGALGVLHATTAAYPGAGVRIQVHGDKGSAVIEDDRLVALTTADRGDDGGSAGAPFRRPSTPSSPSTRTSSPRPVEGRAPLVDAMAGTQTSR